MPTSGEGAPSDAAGPRLMADGEELETAQEEPRLPRGLVVEQFDGGEALDELPEHDVTFQAGRSCSQAVADAPPEAQGLVVAAGYVEPVRVGKSTGVAVGRSHDDREA